MSRALKTFNLDQTVFLLFDVTRPSLLLLLLAAQIRYMWRKQLK